MSTASIRFLHEPRTEQELVCLFITLLEHIDEFPKPIIIERVHEAFPDCIIRSAGTPIRIEFKLYAESYNHSFDGSTVVCWRKGRERRWPADVRIVEIAPIVAAARPDLLVSNDDTYCSGAWSEEGFFAVATREGASALAVEAMREIIRWAGSAGFGPVWKRDPKPQFDIGCPGPYFTVWSDGKFRLVLKRFAETDLLSELLEDLNRSSPSLSLSSSSLRAKKRLVLTEHFADITALKEFLKVWERFDGIIKTR